MENKAFNIVHQIVVFQPCLDLLEASNDAASTGHGMLVPVLVHAAVEVALVQRVQAAVRRRAVVMAILLLNHPLPHQPHFTRQCQINATTHRAATKARS